MGCSGRDSEVGSDQSSSLCLAYGIGLDEGSTFAVKLVASSEDAVVIVSRYRFVRMLCTLVNICRLRIEV